MIIGSHRAIEPLLAAIPAAWPVHRFKAVLDRRDRRNADLAEPMMSLKSSGDVVLRSALGHRQEPDVASLPKYLIAKPGDLIVNPMWLVGGAIGVTEASGAVSPDYRVFATRSHHPRYLHYLLRTSYYVDQYRLYTRAQTTFDRRVQQSDLDNLPVPVPPMDEQGAIAVYLDRETAQIDALIAKQERLIATLRERRGGLIERALVGGLDPAVRLRTTVIPWLAGASVPAHWESTRVKYLALEMRAGEGITAEDIEDVGAYRVFGGNGLRGYATAYTHSGTFVLIGRQGALCGNVHLVHGEFWASEHAIVVTPSKRTDAGWLAHMLRLMNLGQYSMTTAQPGIGVGQIGPLMVPLPPLDEQREIATYIDEQASKIDTLIAKTERFIELSKERRAALITAAVTGQIDVRAAA